MTVTQYFCTTDTPPRFYPYKDSTPEQLKQFPCCLNATTSKGLETLIKSDRIFAFRKLSDGLSYRRKRINRSKRSIESITVGELLKAGYIIDSVPQKTVSIRTVQRNRRRASDLCLVFGKISLANITEDYLWTVHAKVETGFQSPQSHEPPIDIKMLKAFRKGIHQYLKQRNIQPWILPNFDWEWQTNPALSKAVKTKRYLSQYLKTHQNHPNAKQYFQFFRRKQ